MTQRHSRYVSIAIIFFAVLFFTLNSVNVADVLSMMFVKPFSQHLTLPESPVIRISLQHNSKTFKESFIKNSLTTRTGKSAHFLHIPDSLDLASSTLSLQDTVVQLTDVDIKNEMFEDEDRVIYFVRESSPQRMIDIITSEALLITQPPQP